MAVDGSPYCNFLCVLQFLGKHTFTALLRWKCGFSENSVLCIMTWSCCADTHASHCAKFALLVISIFHGLLPLLTHPHGLLPNVWWSLWIAFGAGASHITKLCLPLSAIFCTLVGKHISYMWCICHLVVFPRATALAHVTETSSITLLFYCKNRVSFHAPPYTNREAAFQAWKARDCMHPFCLDEMAHLCSQLLGGGLQ